MKDILLPIGMRAETDPFGLRKLDFSVRVPERSEMFTKEEALTYIQGCDYPASIDDWLVAREMGVKFGRRALKTMTILDAMAGPGRLGRELSRMGAKLVVGHDGDETMIAHNRRQAWVRERLGKMKFVLSPVDAIPLPDNSFDLVVCHNSTHQIESTDKLHTVMREFLRITKPGGHVVIADYQRNTTPEFLSALEERLRWTKQSIIPLLLPTFRAAFSKQEWIDAFRNIPTVASLSVTDAEPPGNLSLRSRKRIDADPVKGHIQDFSPISLRAIAQKEHI